MYTNMIALPDPSLQLTAVREMWPLVAELYQASLITSEESERLRENLGNVVRIQICKSLEVVTKTADVLRRHGLEKESKVLSGKTDIVLILFLCVVLYRAVEQSCYRKLKLISIYNLVELKSFVRKLLTQFARDQRETWDYYRTPHGDGYKGVDGR